MLHEIGSRLGGTLILEKRQTLRNNEYYSTQHTLDNLYNKSRNNSKFTDLMKYINDKNNILLAYRNVKNNKGSYTPGTDNLNIDYYKTMSNEKLVEQIQQTLSNYSPKSVRRVEIPKPNGKKRPLGIPCISDRIIQQSIRQILEPICEAKFHNHSYGFRPNRSTHHAIARSMHLMNMNKLHYVVDIDIKGFFDNVSHNKLKRQLWALGIQDKNLLAIIGKILKSEIQGLGIPTKGTPQGGIISPLLSNIVLNELDWWLSSQWESFSTKRKYKEKVGSKNDQTQKYTSMRKYSNLKEIFFVRYADDFKIFCRDYKIAQRIFIATKMWLKERLNLEISTEKSKVTNLRKNHTEFLGFKLKVKPKKNRYVCQSNMSNKARNNITLKIREQIKRIQKRNNRQEVERFNSLILGLHNYYRCATNVSLDFYKINFLVMRTLHLRLKRSCSKKPKFTETYKRLYGNYRGRIRTVHDVTLFPIYGCSTTPPMNFTQDICNYSKGGRQLLHKRLKGNITLLIYKFLQTDNKYMSAEHLDNSISLLAGQNGICYVTREFLEIGTMECHHKKAKSNGGKDNYKNLVWLNTSAHKLVHAINKAIIDKYLNILKLDKEGLKRLNTLRKLVGNSVI